MFTSYLIAFQNGIYDVRRNKLIPFSMDIPMLFDIDADYIDGECETPCFDKFMADVSGGDHDIVELILQMLGYLMMQGMDGKCFFVLGTAPNSGKSVWGEFISKLFQEDAVGTVPLTELGNRFSLGGLWKRAINISMDLPTRVLNEQEVSQIKMLTGEARMRTEEKYEPVTTTFMHCKYVFATNGQINLKVPDDAFWDRLVFVPFMKSIPEHRQDRFLLSKLWKEKDGIVSKAARAAGTLVRNNYRFKLPEISDHIISEWKMYINESITGFLRSRCVVSPDKSIFSEDIYNAYKLYCTEQEMTVQTQTALSNKITKISGVCKRKERRNADGNPRWKFEGIGLSE
jgi:putative DNA primase/helicase